MAPWRWPTCALVVLLVACGGRVAEDATLSTSGGGQGGGAGPLGGATHVPIPEACSSDADCRLHGSCCSCEALAPGELAPECAADCDFADACREPRIETAVCVVGRCVLLASCDLTEVSCERAAPDCGKLAAPVVEGDCFRGDCLELTECARVGSCTVCHDAGLECVTNRYGRGPGTVHCVRPVAGCGASCECLKVCVTPALCDPRGALVCDTDCPTCG